jgi:hypothetical protein
VERAGRRGVAHENDGGVEASQGFGIGVWLRVGLHVALLALGRERYGQGETRPAIDAWWGLMKGANTRRLLQTYLGRYFARV